MELVCFRHIQLQLSQWCDFVNALFTRYSKRLHDELLFALLGVERFLHASQLRKNWFDARPGENFCDNASNDALLAPWRNWLLVHVDTHAATSALTKDGRTRSGASQWDAFGVRHYLGRVTALVRKLIVLIHMTLGLPARGPELLAVRWCNTELLRNIFICEGYVILLVAYHKLEWRVGTRAVACFLPPAVGNLVVKSIVQVLPFARILQRALHVQQNDNNTSDDGNDRNNHNTNDDTNIDDNEMVVYEQGEADANICLPLLSDTVQRASVFSPSGDSPDNVDNDDDNDDDNNDDDDDDESVANEDNNNNTEAVTCDAVLASSDNSCDAFFFSSDGKQPWDSCELSAALRRKTMYALGVAIAIQAWRHLAIAIDRFYLQGIGARAFGNPFDEAAGIDDSADEYNWHH
jgi:hypothetical protein